MTFEEALKKVASEKGAVAWVSGEGENPAHLVVEVGRKSDDGKTAKGMTILVDKWWAGYAPEEAAVEVVSAGLDIIEEGRHAS